MKRIVLFLGCMALLMASCDKECLVEESKQEEAPRHLSFNFTVNQDSDTRAVKTGWEANDRIYVFFDHEFKDLEYLELTYDGEKWTPSFSKESLETRLLGRSAGTLSAFYLPYGEPNFTYTEYSSSQAYLFLNVKENGKTVFSYFMTAMNARYNVTDHELKATLAMEVPNKYVQFFIPGVSERSHYVFACDQLSPRYLNSFYKASESGKVVDNWAQGNASAGGDLLGIPYKDGLVFSGFGNSVGNSADYTFTVTDNQGTESETDDVTYRLTVAGKTLSSKDAVKLPMLDSDRWEIIAQGTAWHEYVNLGNGLKWSTRNLGATSEVGFGDYYAWGETTPKSLYTAENYLYSGMSKYNNEDEKVLLEYSDDAARANWGGAWRIPTKEEWEWLVSNCTWTLENSGYRVTSNIEGYTDKSIYLPICGAVGWGDGTQNPTLYTQGLYWSSRKYDDVANGSSTNAVVLNFYKEENNYGISNHERWYGIPIRPVSN